MAAAGFGQVAQRSGPLSLTPPAQPHPSSRHASPVRISGYPGGAHCLRSRSLHTDAASVDECRFRSQPQQQCCCTRWRWRRALCPGLGWSHRAARVSSH